MRVFASISLLAALTAMSACAPTSDGESMSGAARPERQCFDADRLRDFHVERNQTLYVTAYDGSVYQLQTSGACHDIDSTFGLALVPFTRGSDRLCTGDWAQVAIQDSTAPSGPCRARVTHRLSEEEIAALPHR